MIILEVNLNLSDDNTFLIGATVTSAGTLEPSVVITFTISTDSSTRPEPIASFILLRSVVIKGIIVSTNFILINIDRDNTSFGWLFRVLANDTINPGFQIGYFGKNCRSFISTIICSKRNNTNLNVPLWSFAQAN